MPKPTLELVLNLNHSQTPQRLAQVNASLQVCLAKVEVDETHLKILIDQRAELVNKLLNTLNEPQRKQFAQQETKINQVLVNSVVALRITAKKALSDVAKSSKAIKQYQQV
jgi:hypothetical protein